jgi:hypothetical protein
MVTFLDRVEASDRELADWIISFSRGSSAGEIAEALRSRLIPMA